MGYQCLSTKHGKSVSGCTLSLSSWFVSKAHDKYLAKIITGLTNTNYNIDDNDDNDNDNDDNYVCTCNN